MKIISGLKRMGRGYNGGVLTLGIFDGVHIGHQKILKKIVERARVTGLKSIVLTFSPHPLVILRPHHVPPFLTSLQKRLELLAGMGIDICLIINFTRAFSKMEASRFVSSILVKKLLIKELIVSDDITLGFNARGGIKLLSRLSKKGGYRLIDLKPVYRDGEIVSSTRIRKLIQHGNLRYAEKLLGRPYSVTGTVMRGCRRGTLLGFPTANIRPHHEVLPPPGVYCGFVLFKKRILKALANFGVRPTFYGEEKSFEVHIIDFKKNIYHKKLEFIFKYYLRQEKVFPDKDALIKQIEKDRERADKLLDNLR